MTDRNRRAHVGPLAVACCSVLAWGCTERASSRSGNGTNPASRRAALTIEGAGATFPKPVYAQWSLRYLEENSVKVAYRAVGSEAGIHAIRDNTVDFGANDLPLNEQQLRDDGLCQFPVVIGAVVPVVNLSGHFSGVLKLSADDLAGIYLGKIKRWNDPAIADDNPGAALPDQEIIPIRRAGSSGTTWIFTSYLREHSQVWRDVVGSANADKRLVGVGAEGNEQVAKFVKQFRYTIGYVEYSFAEQQGLSCVSLRTAAGSYVAASTSTFGDAAPRGEMDTTDDLRVTFSALDAGDTWPIVGASYATIRREQKTAAKAEAMLRFFQWALTDGAEHAVRLGYVKVPHRFVERIERRWSECVRSSGRGVWSPAVPGGPPTTIADAGLDAAVDAAPASSSSSTRTPLPVLSTPQP